MSQIRREKAALSLTHVVLQPDSQKGNSIFNLPRRLAALKTLLEKGTAQLQFLNRVCRGTHTYKKKSELSLCFPEHKREVQRSWK